AARAVVLERLRLVALRKSIAGDVDLGAVARASGGDRSARRAGRREALPLRGALIRFGETAEAVVRAVRVLGARRAGAAAVFALAGAAERLRHIAIRQAVADHVDRRSIAGAAGAPRVANAVGSREALALRSACVGLREAADAVRTAVAVLR